MDTKNLLHEKILALEQQDRSYQEALDLKTQENLAILERVRILESKNTYLLNENGALSQEINMLKNLPPPPPIIQEVPVIREVPVEHGRFDHGLIERIERESERRLKEAHDEIWRLNSLLDQRGNHNLPPVNRDLPVIMEENFDDFDKEIQARRQPPHQHPGPPHNFPTPSPPHFHGELKNTLKADDDELPADFYGIFFVGRFFIIEQRRIFGSFTIFKRKNT